MRSDLPCFLTARYLDEQHRGAPFPPLPVHGWVSTLRVLFGGGLADWADRIGLSASTAGRLSGREQSGAITLGELRRLATQFDCEFTYAFVPQPSFTRIAERELEALNRERRVRKKGPLRPPVSDADYERWFRTGRYGTRPEPSLFSRPQD